jgi:hypothetical protein
VDDVGALMQGAAQKNWSERVQVKQGGTVPAKLGALLTIQRHWTTLMSTNASTITRTPVHHKNA